MTSNNEESTSPKRAKELEKEWKKLHDNFEEVFKEKWKEFHEDERYNDIPEKKKFKEMQSFLMHLRRAISWLDRAQQMEKDEKEIDKDLAPQFIFLWIAFNALYGRDPHRFIRNRVRLRRSSGSKYEKAQAEKDDFKQYFNNFKNNAKDNIYKAMNNVSKAIISLSENDFVGENFWNFHHDIEKKYVLRKSDDPVPPLSKQNMHEVLYSVFQRLYVLRNQLMHGASTWDGHLNKDQLIDGTEIMHQLLPVFIDIMLKTPENKWNRWGRVWYPRVAKEPILKNENETSKKET